MTRRELRETGVIKAMSRKNCKSDRVVNRDKGQIIL